MSARQDIFERIAQAIGPARPPAEIAAEAAALLADPQAVRPPTCLLYTSPSPRD